MSFAEMLSALYNNGTYAAVRRVLRLRRHAKHGSLGEFREKTAANRLERMWPLLSDAARRRVLDSVHDNSNFIKSLTSDRDLRQRLLENARAMRRDLGAAQQLDRNERSALRWLDRTKNSNFAFDSAAQRATEEYRVNRQLANLRREVGPDTAVSIRNSPHMPGSTTYAAYRDAYDIFLPGVREHAGRIRTKNKLQATVAAHELDEALSHNALHGGAPYAEFSGNRGISLEQVQRRLQRGIRTGQDLGQLQTNVAQRLLRQRFTPESVQRAMADGSGLLERGSDPSVVSGFSEKVRNALTPAPDGTPSWSHIAPQVLEQEREQFARLGDAVPRALQRRRDRPAITMPHHYGGPFDPPPIKDNMPEYDQVAPRRQAQYPEVRDRIDRAMERKRQFMLGQPVPGRESTSDAGQQHRMARNRALGERVLRQLGIIR